MQPERRGGDRRGDGLPGCADPASGSMGISDRGLVPRPGPEQIQQLLSPLSVDISPDVAPVSPSGECRVFFFFSLGNMTFKAAKGV